MMLHKLFQISSVWTTFFPKISPYLCAFLFKQFCQTTNDIAPTPKTASTVNSRLRWVRYELASFSTILKNNSFCLAFCSYSELPVFIEDYFSSFIYFSSCFIMFAWSLFLPSWSSTFFFRLSDSFNFASSLILIQFNSIFFSFLAAYEVVFSFFSFSYIIIRNFSSFSACSSAFRSYSSSMTSMLQLYSSLLI